MANFNLNGGNNQWEQGQNDWGYQSQSDYDDQDQSQEQWQEDYNGWSQGVEQGNYNRKKTPSTILVVLTLIFIWPVGIYFTWRTNWSKLIKAVITIVVGILGLGVALLTLTGGVNVTIETGENTYSNEEISKNDIYEDEVQYSNENIDENSDDDISKEEAESQEAESQEAESQEAESQEAESQEAETITQPDTHIENSNEQSIVIDISEIGKNDSTDTIEISEYTLGEVLRVHTPKGDFSIKFNSIQETNDRNYQSDFSPIRVILLNYTVKNLSYSEPLQVLPFNLKVYDYLGDEMKQYHLNTQYGNPLNIGESGDVSIAYGLNSAENPIKIEYYTNTNWEELPKFVINIAEW